MHPREAEIIAVKRLKKDGDLGEPIVERIVAFLLEGAVSLLPVDNVYCIIGTGPEGVRRASARVRGGSCEMTTLISSYRMLDGLAVFTKSDYDFLNRIWPGEVSVILRDQENGNGHKVLIRYPKNRFLQNVIERIDGPLYCTEASTSEKETVYRKKELVGLFREVVDLILVIDELCKKHPQASVIDITGEELHIVRTGKVPAEEIKSLYFLGRADE